MGLGRVLQEVLSVGMNRMLVIGYGGEDSFVHRAESHAGAQTSVDGTTVDSSKDVPAPEMSSGERNKQALGQKAHRTRGPMV